MAIPDKPPEWCLAFVAPCLPSSEWAAWAQAVFSAGAVLAAIGVVWWQLRVSRNQSRDAALLIASGLLTTINQTTAGMQSVAQGLQERILGRENHGNSPLFLASLIATLPLASREDLILLSAGLPTCATKLLRAGNSAQQIRSALEFMGKVGIPPGASIAELCQPLQHLAGEAAKAFAEAQADLDRFCPP
jgi:hypothetical protein